VLEPWNAAALPEIMAGALQESKRGVPSAQKAKQQASNLAASPEHAEVEPQKPARGLTYEVNRRAEGASELNRRLAK